MTQWKVGGRAREPEQASMRVCARRPRSDVVWQDTHAHGDAPVSQAKAAKQDGTVDVESVAALGSSTILTGLFAYPALMASDVLLYEYGPCRWGGVRTTRP